MVLYYSIIHVSRIYLLKITLYFTKNNNSKWNIYFLDRLKEYDELEVHLPKVTWYSLGKISSFFIYLMLFVARCCRKWRFLQISETRFHEIGPIHSTTRLVSLRCRCSWHIFSTCLLIPSRTASSAAWLQNTYRNSGMCRTGHRRRRPRSFRVTIVGHLHFNKFAICGFLQTSKQMVVL